MAEVLDVCHALPDELDAEGVRRRGTNGDLECSSSPLPLRGSCEDPVPSSEGPPPRQLSDTPGEDGKRSLNMKAIGLSLIAKLRFTNDAHLKRPHVPEEGINFKRRPVFGEIQYPGMAMSRYCVVGHSASASLFFGQVASHTELWNLEAPRLLLSIMGGAGQMKLDPDIEASFSEGLARVAKQTGAWVITGGTDTGVMALVGRAMASHDKKRVVPLIGITSFGSLKSRWRERLDGEHPKDDSKVMRIVEAPTLAGEEVEAEKKLAGIQENHTHIILCDGGKRGPKAFGQETQFRAEFEEKVAQMFKPRPSDMTQSVGRRRGSNSGSSMGRGASKDGQRLKRSYSNSSCPESQMSGEAPVGEAEALRVMILVNGGAVSFESVAAALDHECPVVICRGSGRAADFLAALKDVFNDTFKENPRNPSFAEYDKAWKNHMNARGDAKIWEERWSKDDANGLGLIRRIIESESAVVFVKTDRLEDVVIGAVLRNICAKNSNPERQDSVTSVQESKSRSRAAFKEALDLAVHWQCIKHCRDLCCRLMHLDGDNDDQSLRWIIDRLVNKQWVEADASHIVKILYEQFPAQMKTLSLATEFAEDLYWNGLANFQDKATTHLDAAAIFFLWLIEQGASSEVVDAMWLQQEFPAHAALAAASAYRQTAVRKHFESAMRKGRTLAEEGDRYELFAVRLLQEIPADPVEFLFRQSSATWGFKNLVMLAHHLECKSFVQEPRYSNVVNLLWFTPAPFEKYYFTRYENKRQLHSLMGVPLLEIAQNIITGRYPREASDTELCRQELWSIPKIKSLTHCLSRVVFILVYSWYVLYSEGWSAIFLQVILYWYGFALAAIEALQILEKTSIRDYLGSLWNVFDVVSISVLMTTLLLDTFFVPAGLLSSVDTRMLHSLNLLPCYCRLLQMFELSEYFGTLFVTFTDMYRDTLNFMVLLSIVGIGFSCTITPMLWPTVEARWDLGVFWIFWAIFGEIDEEKNQKSSQPVSTFSWMVSPLRYFLYLTLNVLLQNLLIAQMSDTFTANKEESKRVWAYQCVDAVLEFASPEAHVIPPPFDLFQSLRTLHQEFLKKGHKVDDDDDEDYFGHVGAKTLTRQASRHERRAMAGVQQKVILEGLESKASQEEVAEEAMVQVDTRLRHVGNQIEKIGGQFQQMIESTSLREEITALKLKNVSLEEENRKIKVWYSLLAGRAARLMAFVDRHKTEQVNGTTTPTIFETNGGATENGDDLPGVE